ncbi:MAG: hypothetical protein U1E48_09340 [Paracoccaceae bacterium]|mgnify:CR=1 FL=1
MNRNVAIALVIAILAAGGYWYYSGQKPAMEQPAASTSTEASTAASTATEASTASSTASSTDTSTASSTASSTDTSTASSTASSTAAAPASSIAADLLDPTKFDADKLNAAIDATSLDAATKTTLKTAVTAAKDNPAAVQTAIDAVKKALGM